MSRKRTRHLQRAGVMTVIAVAPAAIMAASLTDLLVPTSKPVSYEYIETAAINNDPDTIGFADSDLYGMSEADIIRTLDEMQALGVNDVRVFIPWAFVQPLDPETPLPPWIPSPYFDWAKTDFIVNQAAARDMGVLGALNSTPGWAAQPGGFGYGAAPDPQAFADFAGLVAERYAGKVSAYEVWNEPNTFGYWTPGPDPVAYTELLKAGYTAIKAADSDALVVGGVLVTVVDFGIFTDDPVTFVETMYANGAQGYFDALSIHPYQYTTKFSEGGVFGDAGPINQLIAIRQLMIDNGDEDLRIWATEYGLPTGGPTAVTEQHQADFIRDFLDTWDDLDYVGPNFIYTTRDRMDSTTEEGSIGVFNHDWTPKLAAEVIREMIEEDQIVVPPPPPPPGPGVEDDFGQALAAFYQQLVNAYAQAYVQVVATAADAFVQAVATAYVEAISQALNQFFSGLAVPPEQQDAVIQANEVAVARVAVTAPEATVDVAEAAGTPAAAADAVSAAAAPAEVKAGAEAATAEVAATAASAESAEAATAEEATAEESSRQGTTTESEATTESEDTAPSEDTANRDDADTESADDAASSRSRGTKSGEGAADKAADKADDKADDGRDGSKVATRSGGPADAGSTRTGDRSTAATGGAGQSTTTSDTKSGAGSRDAAADAA